MSLCVSFYLNGNIYVFADTRVSAYKNGRSYYVHDNYNKLREVGDKVVFTSGELEICENLFAVINERSTVEDIAEAARKAYNDFKRANPDYDGGKYGIEFGAYVHAIEDGVPVYYQLRYIDDFKVERRVPNNQELFAVAGRSEEALAYIAKLAGKGVPIDDAIMRTYEHLANEFIGGKLVRYTVSPSAVERLVRPIRDTKPLRMWSVRGASLHADMQGNVVARKITLTGTVENSDIISGTITGALIRTAASGARFEASSTGWRTYDSSNRQRISIDINNQYGMSAISFARSDGSALGYINGGDSLFQITSLSDIMIAAPGRTITMQGYTRFNDGVEFDGGVSGISISSVSGLQSQLNSLSSQISRVPDNSEIATNMNFDPNTRNLKLYSASGTTLATVNIP
ncbi:hypothetical protein MJ257_17100 [Paenibacillus timonensis]|uniref:Uncharacterized protein n=1 Tax=Paenibacillus timonensis TaxID=225915 RepID=A0ABW3SGC0_9BACL|nr:hypothetical protein [Paenibacillus timonensis]MCH1641815.1 hypothetical protein [Paenibacillus timonensis]